MGLLKDLGGGRVSTLRKHFEKSKKIEEADVTNKLQIAKETAKLKAKPSKTMVKSLQLLFDIIQPTVQA